MIISAVNDIVRTNILRPDTLFQYILSTLLFLFFFSNNCRPVESRNTFFIHFHHVDGKYLENGDVILEIRPIIRD